MLPHCITLHFILNHLLHWFSHELRQLGLYSAPRAPPVPPGQYLAHPNNTTTCDVAIYGPTSYCEISLFNALEYGLFAPSPEVLVIAMNLFSLLCLNFYFAGPGAWLSHVILCWNVQKIWTFTKGQSNSQGNSSLLKTSFHLINDANISLSNAHPHPVV